MTLQEHYDNAMLAFSRGEFAAAAGQFRAVLARDAAYFDAQLALGVAYYRLGNFAAAIVEGHKAEQLRPQEQLVHTNLSLFYLKSGDKMAAEHHGLQARIARWRAEHEAARSNPSGEPAPTDSELQMARPQPPPTKVIRLPDKYPEPPRKQRE